MCGEFKFNPPKTYASEENARKAITSVLGEGDRFIIVGVPGTLRYAPIVIHSNPGNLGRYPHLGFTVVG